MKKLIFVITVIILLPGCNAILWQNAHIHKDENGKVTSADFRQTGITFNSTETGQSWADAARTATKKNIGEQATYLAHNYG